MEEEVTGGHGNYLVKLIMNEEERVMTKKVP